MGIGILPFQQAAKVDAIVGGIDEWIARRVRRDLERRPLGGVGFQYEIALDAQLGRRLRERRDGDRIAENIMHPANRRRRRECQIGFNQAKIVAIARAQHQSMIAEHDGTIVAINRGVPHIENGHRRARPARDEEPSGPAWRQK
jgi:hypothetical protein